MKSIGSIIDANRGLAPGFGFLRMALAFSVVFIHAETVATGRNYDSSQGIWLYSYAILVMFFALSGFLITGSAMRLGLKNFLINRGLRIFPALFIEVTLSAFVLGGIFTELPLRSYYENMQTWHYMTNIFGWINYYLPAVFSHNPKSAVNWSLWTVPYEFGCYGLMSTIIIFKLLHKRLFPLALACLFLAVGLAGFGGNAFTGEGSKLFVSFLLGISAYLWREHIPYDWHIFAACILFCMAVSLIRPQPWMSIPLLNLIIVPVTVYMTVFIGATRIPTLPGDLSYGIYLYGNPIQQAIRASFPATNTWWLNFLASFFPILAFAAFSWWCLEKPILHLRRHFSFIART
jgi:peptidoglycan/LPS O-acetylase OafA/YrhL